MAAPTPPPVPVAEAIYSALAFHAPAQHQELPGRWLVAALGAAGIESAAVRQAVFRLEREGHVVSRRQGRAKWYRLTTTGLAQIVAGRQRLLPSPRVRWDGQWTIVALAFEGPQRRAREQFLAVLGARGYGRTRAGLRLHPHDEPHAVIRLARELRVDGTIEVYRGSLPYHSAEIEIVRHAFPLREIATAYRGFVKRFSRFDRQRARFPRTAFTLRLAVAHHYLDAAWDDPGLARHFLPADWPGGVAHRLAQRLYLRAAPGAHQFAEEVARRLSLPWKRVA